jgi:hypothetical protein
VPLGQKHASALALNTQCTPFALNGCTHAYVDVYDYIGRAGYGASMNCRGCDFGERIYLGYVLEVFISCVV